MYNNAVDVYNSTRSAFIEAGRQHVPSEVPSMTLDTKEVLSRNGSFRASANIENRTNKPLEAFHRRNRALEEMQMVQREATNVLAYGKTNLDAINNALRTLEHSSNQKDKARVCRSRIFQKIMRTGNRTLKWTISNTSNDREVATINKIKGACHASCSRRKSKNQKEIRSTQLAACICIAHLSSSTQKSRKQSKVW
ncbi:hypothetical protein BJV82DRAFT_337699 [Fennellomyces sp. T-0311]|nr:hypothetical protein BJV82DRAFT_337699 [Fennellomyces sp. T-0311]